MKSAFLSLLVLLAAMIAGPAWALDLQSARANGLVGEQLNGYVAAIQSTGEVNALVAEVNAKRREEYARISQQNGQPVDVVAKLAAEQVINNLPAGAMYQTPGGWKKR